MLINRWIVYANLIAELLWIFRRNKEKPLNTYQMEYSACVPCPCHISRHNSQAIFLSAKRFPWHLVTHTHTAYVSKAFCLFKLTKRMRAPHCCSVCSSFNCFCFASLCYHISFPPSCPGIHSFLFVTRCARSFSFPLNSCLPVCYGLLSRSSFSVFVPFQSWSLVCRLVLPPLSPAALLSRSSFRSRICMPTST